MASISDIKTIMYTEKSITLQEEGFLVVQTNQKVTKTQLKEIFQEYFEVTPEKINSAPMKGKVKRFRGVMGKRSSYKKFYVKLPEGTHIETLSV